MTSYPAIADVSIMTPFEKMNAFIAYYREWDDIHKKEIKELDKWRKTTDYTKWKCDELRIHIRKKLEDEPESRVGLSKWKKDELIYKAKLLDENRISHLHYKRQDELWNILQEKIRYRCEQQGIRDERLIIAKQNFHHKCCDKYKGRDRHNNSDYLFLLYPDWFNEIDEEIATYQFKEKEDEDNDEEEDSDDDDDDGDNDEDDDDDDDEEEEIDKELEDRLWSENLAMGDKYSRMMEEAMKFSPNDREGQIAFLSVRSHGTFNGLVRYAIPKEEFTLTRIS
jgi:hypothetical protein